MNNQSNVLPNSRDYTLYHHPVADPLHIPSWEEALSSFETFPMEKAASINLNARFDAKFLIPWKIIAPQFGELKKNFLLQLNQRQIALSAYTTRYWDLPGYAFFHQHATGRLQRMRVRKRLYRDTGDCFLEIKQKRQYKTMKVRTPSVYDAVFSPGDNDFLQQHGVAPHTLQPVLDVRYRRITLWDFHTQGRITVDVDYTVAADGREAAFPGIAIIEVKGSQKYITQTLKKFPIPLQRYRTSFSKYGMGIVQLKNYQAAYAKEQFAILKQLLKRNANV